MRAWGAAACTADSCCCVHYCATRINLGGPGASPGTRATTALPPGAVTRQTHPRLSSTAGRPHPPRPGPPHTHPTGLPSTPTRGHPPAPPSAFHLIVQELSGAREVCRGHRWSGGLYRCKRSMCNALQPRHCVSGWQRRGAVRAMLMEGRGHVGALWWLEPAEAKVDPFTRRCGCREIMHCIERVDGGCRAVARRVWVNGCDVLKCRLHSACRMRRRQEGADSVPYMRDNHLREALRQHFFRHWQWAGFAGQGLELLGLSAWITAQTGADMLQQCGCSCKRS